MKAPDLRLKTADFPGVDWIDKLLRPLMLFATQTQNALTKGLTFQENIASQELEFLIQMQSAHHNVTLNQSWGNFQSLPTPAWRKTADGLVVLSGACSLGQAGSPLCTLPETVWPEKEVHGVCYASFDLVPGYYRVRIDQYGVVFLGEGAGGACNEAHLSIIYEAADLTPSINAVFPLAARLTLASPVGVVPLRVVELPSARDERPVSKALSVDWSVQNEKLVINDIAGLQPGKSYRMTLLVYGG